LRPCRRGRCQLLASPPRSREDAIATTGESLIRVGFSKKRSAGAAMASQELAEKEVDEPVA
jgi:hypothetical protein